MEVTIAQVDGSGPCKSRISGMKEEEARKTVIWLKLVAVLLKVPWFAFLITIRCTMFPCGYFRVFMFAKTSPHRVILIFSPLQKLNHTCTDVIGSKTAKEKSLFLNGTQRSSLRMATLRSLACPG